MQARCGIVSHRGLCRLRPEEPRRGENTLEAFDAGVAALQKSGLPLAVEFDVRLSADGVPVVVHDDTVDRTTNGRGAVCSLTLADIRTLDAGDGRRVPSLAEVLNHFKDADVLFHIELKENNLAGVIEQHAHDAGAQKKIIVSAFDDDDQGDPGENPKASSSWADLSVLAGRLPIALLATKAKVRMMGGAAAYVNAAKMANARAVHPACGAATAELVALAHEAGLQVNAWTVNKRAEYETLAARGVDNVFSDNPNFLVS